MADSTTWLQSRNCVRILECYCTARLGRWWFDARQAAGKNLGKMVGSAVVGKKSDQGVNKVWRRNVALGRVTTNVAQGVPACNGVTSRSMTGLSDSRGDREAQCRVRPTVDEEVGVAICVRMGGLLCRAAASRVLPINCWWSGSTVSDLAEAEGGGQRH